MGRLLRLIGSLCLLPFVLLAVAIGALGLCFRRAEEETLELDEETVEAVADDPELDHDDKDRRWRFDLPPQQRVEAGFRAHLRQQALVVPEEPIAEWVKRRRILRMGS